MVLDASLAFFRASWTSAAPYAETLLTYAGGIAVYTSVVFTFYERVSQHRVFLLRDRGTWRRWLLRVFESLALLPVFAFLYFVLLSIALIFLAKSRAVEDVIVLALSVVLGIRVVSMMGRGMAVDLAKLLPLGLLAVVLVEPGYFDVREGFTRARVAFRLWPLFAWGGAAILLSELLVQAVGAFHRTERVKEQKEKAREADAEEEAKEEKREDEREGEGVEGEDDAAGERRGRSDEPPPRSER